MNNSHSASYAAAGVNIEAGYEGVRLMKQHVQRTFIPGVVSDIGGFGGLFRPELAGMKHPVLVSGTDGVGTKQRIAQLMGINNTVGIDCVAMCVNDIVCCGAKPLFFLDYIAIGRNEPEKVAALVSGVAEGCVQAGCALIGGETAEHPGTMQPEDYDLAGFSVGIVDQDRILRKDSVRKGDVIEFPDSWDDVQVFNQPVRANGTVNQALLVVLRNGNPDYLSIGSLRKQDVDRNYTCPFTEEMGKLNNDYDRINTLLGKKIKGVDSKTIKTQAFDRITGERLEGQTRDQVVPIIEYV